MTLPTHLFFLPQLPQYTQAYGTLKGKLPMAFIKWNIRRARVYRR